VNAPGANAPELTKSLPPQHRTVISQRDNRDMRLPSDQRARVSRSFVLRAVLAAVLAALTVAPIADASKVAKGDTGLFVSKGVGRQTFTGGSGVVYGSVFSGGSLVVADFSATHDMRVDSPVAPTLNAGGSRTYVPAPGTKPRVGMGFKISGTLYRAVMVGSVNANGAGVYGRLQVRGKGTLSVNGEKLRWNTQLGNIGKIPKDVKKLFQLALGGGPPPAPPAPPVTVPPPTTVTTGN
jgi:hypothetical protein